MTILSRPPTIIEWSDPERTGALGWIVIHNEIGGVSGGGLFMDESATLNEVQDLAQTMALKNSLQNPMLGGGKGGIRFSPKDPRSSGVLDRFLRDHKSLIENKWCTGGDIHTTTDMITQSLRRVSNLESPFVSLAQYVQKKTGQSVDIKQFHDLLSESEEECDPFPISHSITGYSIARTLSILMSSPEKPKILIQGFGKVGKGLAFHLKDDAVIVGICERDWAVYHQDGLDSQALLKNQIPEGAWIRPSSQSSNDFLTQFLMTARSDVFCPCAVRYSVTPTILECLRGYTFSQSTFGDGFIIAGSNNIFSKANLEDVAQEFGIAIVPEWISNVGSALLFMEALKYQGDPNHWPTFIKKEVNDRIRSFLNTAKRMAEEKSLSLYAACTKLACEKIQHQEE
jgi:glutamate dehydrogenase (NAD(P)+)